MRPDPERICAAQLSLPMGHRPFMVVMSVEIDRVGQTMRSADAFRPHDDWHGDDPAGASQGETKDADYLSRKDAPRSAMAAALSRTGSVVLRCPNSTHA